MDIKPAKLIRMASRSMAPHAPKVSIGMPVYNGGTFLREAIDSLLVQTFTDFELIISDNASTDNTEQVCLDYVHFDSRIRYIRLADNIGAPNNFFYVRDQAVGEYFMWAAHDDRWKPNCLALWVNVLDSDPSVGLVFSGVELFDHSTSYSFGYTTGFIASRHKLLRVLFRVSNGCSALIYGLHRSSLIRAIGNQRFDFFDVYIALWYELNSSIRVVPLPLFVSGTNGIRVSYSLTGDRISDRAYLAHSFRLFCSAFPLTVAILLFVFLWVQSSLAVRNLNQIRFSSLRSN
jgi:glycosyltransferase involved in cell wall biosynthesis